SAAGHFPSRRTFERRLAAVPEHLPAQIALVGAHLLALLNPWAEGSRAVAMDSTPLAAHGGVWHQKDQEAGVIPHTSIDTEAHWTKSGWHGWVYGWKLHLTLRTGSSPTGAQANGLIRRRHPSRPRSACRRCPRRRDVDSLAVWRGELTTTTAG